MKRHGRPLSCAAPSPNGACHLSSTVGEDYSGEQLITTFNCIITPWGMANSLVMFLEDDNEENKQFAREQILALCEFYEEHKPKEDDND